MEFLLLSGDCTSQVHEEEAHSGRDGDDGVLVVVDDGGLDGGVGVKPRVKDTHQALIAARVQVAGRARGEREVSENWRWSGKRNREGALSVWREGQTRRTIGVRTDDELGRVGGHAELAVRPTDGGEAGRRRACVVRERGVGLECGCRGRAAGVPRAL